MSSENTELKHSFGDSYSSEDTKFVRPPQADDGETKGYNIVLDILYPCLVLEAESMPQYKMRVLRNALEQYEYGHDKVLENYYDVYLQVDGYTISLGMVHSDNLRAILQGPIFNSLNKYIMKDAQTKVVGNMMLSLCTSSRY